MSRSFASAPTASSLEAPPVSGAHRLEGRWVSSKWVYRTCRRASTRYAAGKRQLHSERHGRLMVRHVARLEPRAAARDSSHDLTVPRADEAPGDRRGDAIRLDMRSSDQVAEGDREDADLPMMSSPTSTVTPIVLKDELTMLAIMRAPGFVIGRIRQAIRRCGVRTVSLHCSLTIAMATVELAMYRSSTRSWCVTSLRGCDRRCAATSRAIVRPSWHMWGRRLCRLPRAAPQFSQLRTRAGGLTSHCVRNHWRGARLPNLSPCWNLPCTGHTSSSYSASSPAATIFWRRAGSDGSRDIPHCRKRSRSRIASHCNWFMPCRFLPHHDGRRSSALDLSPCCDANRARVHSRRIGRGRDGSRARAIQLGRSAALR